MVFVVTIAENREHTETTDGRYDLTIKTCELCLDRA